MIKDFIEFMIVLFIFFLAIGFLVTAPVVFADAYACKTYQEITGKETKYAGFDCFIKAGNEWMLYEEYKLRNVTTGTK